VGLQRERDTGRKSNERERRRVSPLLSENAISRLSEGSDDLAPSVGGTSVDDRRPVRVAGLVDASGEGVDEVVKSGKTGGGTYGGGRGGGQHRRRATVYVSRETGARNKGERRENGSWTSSRRKEEKEIDVPYCNAELSCTLSGSLSHLAMSHLSVFFPPATKLHNHAPSPCSVVRNELRARVVAVRVS
jgi:hypothetical protein